MRGQSEVTNWITHWLKYQQVILFSYTVCMKNINM